MRLPLLSLLFALLLAPAMVRAIEEPPYELLRTLEEGVELRRYPGYVVAEVVLPGPPLAAGNQAFPILAGYIFGKNQGERRYEMTAPVTLRAEPSTLPMTAPVTTEAVPGGSRVQFVLPRGVRLADAPLPLDPRVQLREEPATVRAVIRYSGFWSAANDGEHTDKLRAALARAGLQAQGEPVLARYNGPLTPWFLRRNEVWLKVE